jgi:hypothetical protein
LIQLIPVPGRTVSSLGTKVLFRIWIVVTAVDAVLAAWGVATATAPGVPPAGGAVVTTVVGCPVAGAGVSCVHPLMTTRRITRMNKPINFIIKTH